MSNYAGGSRLNLLATLSILIALFSMGAAMFQGYVNSRNLEVVQRDLARREHLRACKEAIEAYFDVKLKSSFLVRAGVEGGASFYQMQAQAAVSRMGAIGTYLANFQGEAARAQYTSLTQELARIVDAASAERMPEMMAQFARADELFARMNDDCVGAAKNAMQ